MFLGYLAILLEIFGAALLIGAAFITGILKPLLALGDSVVFILGWNLSLKLEESKK